MLEQEKWTVRKKSFSQNFGYREPLRKSHYRCSPPPKLFLNLRQYFCLEYLKISCGLENRKIVVRSPAETRDFSRFRNIQTMTLVQLRVQCILGARSPGVKLLLQETDLSPPSSSKNKNAWSHNSTPPNILTACTGTTFINKTIFLQCKICIVLCKHLLKHSNFLANYGNKIRF